MSNDDIEDVIERFIFTAKIAQDTGFTGIQIHSAHGYLMSEFLSPDINRREDQWGGSLENRSRILLRIINGCRKELGENFPISVKLNSADFQKGGFSAEDSSKVAAMLSDAKIDLLEISGGTYEQPRLLGLDSVSINPKRSEARKVSTIAREAYFLAYTEEIKKGKLVAVLYTLLTSSSAVLIGIIGRLMFTTQGQNPETILGISGENVLYILLIEIMPTIIVGVYIAAVLSAVMSTVDSLLVVASVSYTHLTLPTKRIV